MSRGFLVISIALSASMFSAGLLIGAQVRDTSARGPEQVERVLSFDALKPSTAGERGRAEYFDEPGNSKLSERWRANGLTVVSQGHAVDVVPAKRPTDAEALGTQVCSADAIVVGAAISRHAVLTKSENWLFTDYVVTVNRWIRPSGNSTRSVVISSPNGEVYVGNGRLSTSSNSAKLPLLRLHQEQVFYLKRLGGPAASVEGYSLFGVPATPGDGLAAQEREAVRNKYLSEMDVIAASCRTLL